MKKIFYDIEVLPNFFTVVFIDSESDKVIKLRLESIAMIRKVATSYTLIGYNNHNYDDVILKHIIADNATHESIYKLSSALVTNKLTRTDAQKRLINKYKYMDGIDSIDVMTLLASSKLRVSLKHLQVKIKWHNVLDFEVDWTKPLDPSRFDGCEEYCVNDVLSLKAVTQTLTKDFKLREYIMDKYKLDCRSMDGVMIAETMLCQHIADNLGLDFKEFMYTPNTRVTSIVLSQIIDDFIVFKTPKFQAVLDYYKSKVYLVPEKDKEKKDKQLNYNLDINNQRFVCGSGGIHAQPSGRILEAKHGGKLLSIDVSGYYPSQIIKLGYKHPHDPLFIVKYEEAYVMKSEGKKTGDSGMELLGKLIGNSSFGFRKPLRFVKNCRNRMNSGKLLLKRTILSQAC